VDGAESTFSIKNSEVTKLPSLYSI
jgi:hypothetical protein